MITLQDIERDHWHYKQTLSEMGYTEEQVQEQMLRTPVVVFEEEYDVRFDKSLIHGVGMYATRAFEIGDTICSCLFKGSKTVAGRYTNHSMCPNAIAVKTGSGNIYFKAIQHINPDDEITSDYKNNFNVSVSNFGHTLKDYYGQINSRTIG
jgi:hypothetical protein